MFLPRGQHPSGAAGAVEHRPDRGAALQRVVVLENRMLIQALPNRPLFKLWLQDRYGVALTTVERIQGVLHVMVSEGLGRRERCIERSARCWHK